MMNRVLSCVFFALTALMVQGQGVGNPFAYAGHTPGLVKGLVLDTVMVHDGSIPNIPAGSITYRLYVEMLNSTDALVAIGADNSMGWPLEFNTTTTFHNSFPNYFFGTDVNLGFANQFPDIPYDSWLTIGADYNQHPCMNNSALLVSTPFDGSCTTGSESYFNGNCPNKWLLIEANQQSPCNFGTGPDNRVLIGQFTTDGIFTYRIGMLMVLENGQPCKGQLYVGGYQYGQPNEYFNNPFAPFYIEDATCLPGMSHPSESESPFCLQAVGCTDPGACNYETGMYIDDGSCDYSCLCQYDLNGDGVVGYADLIIVLNELNCTGFCMADFNNDGIVGYADLIMILNFFGSTCQ
jgi:hypothetical protein